jgi:hypothetical protein
MSRSGFLALAAVCFALALTVAYYAIPGSVDNELDAPPLLFTGGRVQLVIDEENVGLVQRGTPLAVTFTIANTGNETLVLRQVQADRRGSAGPLPTFSIEPGQSGEVTAELLSDELLDRGRKHIRFLTSDPANRELWLTVRGTVLRPAARDDDW